MRAVAELFGRTPTASNDDWIQVVNEQQCPFLARKCYKVRKSDPATSIGSCTVLYGQASYPILICPTRLTKGGQVFTDALHLLTIHEPGNELHLVPEVTIPGGSVDYFLVSVRKETVKDFVGIELQALDTTGTVWPERQRLLRDLGVPRSDDSENSGKPFGINWKMTAKTTLVQLHHKIETFEHLNKRLLLVTQDKLLDYMKQEFTFGHLTNPAVIGDAMQLHAYSLQTQQGSLYKLTLRDRLSTNADGIAACLGLQAEPKIELQEIVQVLQSKIGSSTLFNPI